jgi:hypothetical protein
MSQQINLLPRHERHGRTAVAIGGAVLLALVAFAVQWTLAASETAELRRRQLAGEELFKRAQGAVAQLQRARAAGGDAAALSAELALLRPRAEAVSQLVNMSRNGALGRAEGYSDYGALLSSVAEEGVWVTGMVITRSGSSVVVTGRAMQNEAVLRYAKRLGAAFAQHGVHFNSLEMTPENLPTPGTLPAQGPAPLVTVAFRLS